MFAEFSLMPTMLQAYWIMAALASIVFIIQAIMTFAGFDADADADLVDAPDDIPSGGGDAAFDADGFHLVSVKSIICFILGFGWTGVLCWDLITNRYLLALCATLVGLVFMASIAFLIYQIMKLNRDNTFHVEHVVGKTAEVYLRIPAARQDSGKITISHNGSVHELEAFTQGEAIPTGAKVRIVEKVDGDTVIVEKL